jgi:hypothetical protein
MNCVSKEKYPATHRHTIFMTLFFASAYVCKEMFTGMKHVKCMTRSRITERHLQIHFALVIRPFCVIFGVFFVISSAKLQIDILVSEEK